jgi:K+-transporting ATPase, c chain
MIKNIFKALRITAILWLLTAVIYPSLIFAVGTLPFVRDKATASIIYNLDNKPIGSALIGQVFTSDKSKVVPVQLDIVRESRQNQQVFLGLVILLLVTLN